MMLDKVTVRIEAEKLRTTFPRQLLKHREWESEDGEGASREQPFLDSPSAGCFLHNFTFFVFSRVQHGVSHGAVAPLPYALPC